MRQLSLFLCLIIPLFVLSQNEFKSINFSDDAYVNIGKIDFEFTDQFTVMGWLKWNVDPSTGEQWANVVTINSSETSDFGQFWIQHNSNNSKLEFALQLNSGRQYLWSQTEMKEEEWVHFAATYNGSQQKLYINGILESSRARTGDIKSFDANFSLTLGCWAAWDFGRNFEGEIDEISLWKRALTQTEIRSMMCRNILTYEPGLVAYYSMDVVDSNVLKDSKNNYDGTISGANIVISTVPIGNESVFTYFDGDLSVYKIDESYIEVCNGHEEWNLNTEYNRQSGGYQVIVTYQDTLYKLDEDVWWSQGDVPGESKKWLFYSECGVMVDLCQFGEEWVSTTAYQRDPDGQQIFVTRHGDLYEMTLGEYWSENHPPEKPQYSQYWTFIKECEDYMQPTCGEYEEWQSDVPYQKESQQDEVFVFFNDNIYKLRVWHSINQVPDANQGQWNYIGPCQDNNNDISLEPVNLSGIGGINDSLILEAFDHSIIVSEFTGDPLGVHLYKVNNIDDFGGSGSSQIARYVGDNYWGVYVVGGEDVTFKYSQNLKSNSNIFIDDSLNIAYRDNQSEDWFYQPISKDLEDSVGYFYADGTFNHREYALIKEQTGLLPIELLYFNPECGQENGVDIKWSTSTEINNDYFTIYKSLDGKDWEIVAEISGAGNSNMVLDYEYHDVEPTTHDTYYKLAQTDYDGTREEFDIISIYCKYNHKEIKIFPNPATDYINLTFINEHHIEAPLLISVFNSSGVMVHQQEFFAGPDYNDWKLDLPAHLSNGTYFMHVKLGADYFYTNPFIVSK